MVLGGKNGLLALPSNIRLCWKCLAITNNLAYYGAVLITTKKRLQTGPGLMLERKVHLRVEHLKGVLLR